MLLDMEVDEKMRLSLLAEEKKLRDKQPEAWTKTKFRKYANFGRNRGKTVQEILGFDESTKKETKNKSKK